MRGKVALQEPRFCGTTPDGPIARPSLRLPARNLQLRAAPGYAAERLELSWKTLEMMP